MVEEAACVCVCVCVCTLCRMMREYARWDALVAELSSDEESEVEGECADIVAKMEDAVVSGEGDTRGEKNGGVRVARGRGIGVWPPPNSNENPDMQRFIRWP